MPTSLFFSYSHADEALRDELETQLTMLRREGLIEAWHDRRLVAGDEIDPGIAAKLEEADVILFLVSPDFLASEYCYGIEMQRAMARHEAGEARVIPVILRPCEWRKAPFGKLLAAPTDGKPVTKWPDKDDAFLDVTRAIRKAMGGGAAQAAPTPGGSAVGSLASAPIALASASFPRSSNLRVTKQFTQRDRDRFLDETFGFLERFFEGSLGELETRNEGIETRFRRIDADRFTATVYRDGAQVSACTVHRGGYGSGESEIRYGEGQGAETNSWNEAVHVEADDQSLHLVAMGISFHAPDEANRKLTMEGAAEMFWSILMGPLQRH